MLEKNKMEKKIKVHIVICNLSIEEKTELLEKLFKLTKKKIMCVNSKFIKVK